MVINHHLFFADMAVKETGFGELIPHAEVIIFDEAHQLPDIAVNILGNRSPLDSYLIYAKILILFIVPN